MKRTFLIVAFSLVGFFDLSAQQVHVATNAPKDKPLRGEAKTFDALVAPYVAMARKSYPEAKAGFLKGLPPKESFLVTVRVYDESGNFEQIFIVVGSIKDGTIKGKIASDVERIAGYARGDQFECKEKDIFDWCITKPDGSEEGNVVGKFLDVVEERHVPLIIEMVVDDQGKVTSAKFNAALNQSKQDVSFCIPGEVKTESERIILAQHYEASVGTKTNYTYLIYDFQEKKIEPIKRSESSGGGGNTSAR